MGRIAIRRVQYFGDQYSFDSGLLPDGLVIVEGANGSGKTTFTELIYFALGGTVKQFQQKGTEQHREIRSDRNNGVSLTIEINGQHYLVIRHFSVPEDVLVASSHEPDATVFPVNRYGSRRVFSDWLLEKLGIRVVTLTTGAFKGKLNFLDLMRLIYHDQEPNPSRIFRRPDRENNFVSDSRDFRKAVFEILIGRASDEYYEALGELKLAEADLSEKRVALASYGAALDRMGPRRQEANSHFLEVSISEQEAHLARLVAIRADLRQNAPDTPARSAELLSLRQAAAAAEAQVAAYERKATQTREERIRLTTLEAQLYDDVKRIQKIMHAHESLQLFQPDACPCCLRSVDRKPGHCICGQPIDEGAYQRVFYTTEEYTSILKSRRKNTETVRSAIDACDDDLKTLSALIAHKEGVAHQFLEKLEGWAGSSGVYTTELERVDEELAEVRVALERARSALELQRELERAMLDVQEAGRLVERLESRVAALEAAAQEQRDTQLRIFDQTYSQLLRSTLAGVNSARLSQSYEPIINEGDYREASSGVTRRLMYYLAFLKMSLADSAMPFPRFLLVDTPETAGIDTDALYKAIGTIDQILTDGQLTGQVILTTGPRKYPEALTRCRVLSLTDRERLLRATPVKQS